MKTRWLACLLAPLCAGAAAASSAASPGQAVAAFWRALSHGPNASADVAALERLFHADGVVFGGRYQAGEPTFRLRRAAEFVDAQRSVAARGFHECEIARSVQAYDRFAAVYSVVESRTDKAAARPDFTGVNSLQLYRVGDEWKIVSLYYHVEKDGLPIPLAGGVSGRCLDQPA
ncbi:MAG: nuclear transport factor 2 family protein [Rhodanobacteraceae bacterium]|jgi:hypothetical protein|nr:nuclear transport factor 2 family protein [Rhodanobacteraceae bacterium]